MGFKLSQFSSSLGSNSGLWQNYFTKDLPYDVISRSLDFIWLDSSILAALSKVSKQPYIVDSLSHGKQHNSSLPYLRFDGVNLEQRTANGYKFILDFSFFSKSSAVSTLSDSEFLIDTFSRLESKRFILSEVGSGGSSLDVSGLASDENVDEAVVGNLDKFSRDYSSLDLGAVFYRLSRESLSLERYDHQSSWQARFSLVCCLSLDPTL